MNEWMGELHFPEQDDLVTPALEFGRCWVRISAGEVAILMGYCWLGLLQFLQENARIVPRLGLDRFLPHPSHFIVYKSAYHRAVCSVHADSREGLRKP
jgi:hypothetical protein